MSINQRPLDTIPLTDDESAFIRGDMALTDQGLAIRFAHESAPKLRFRLQPTRSWWAFDGTSWRRDRVSVAAEAIARDFLTRLAHEVLLSAGPTERDKKAALRESRRLAGKVRTLLRCATSRRPFWLPFPGDPQGVK